MTEYAIIEGSGDRLSSTLKKNLRAIVEKKLKKDWDYVLLIQGNVGKGKSQLAALIAAYVSELTGVPFDIRNVFFTSTQYRERMKDLPEMSSIIFDEAEEVFFSRNVMSKSQKQMMLHFAQIRRKHNFIILCVPHLLMLEKWIRGLGTDSRINAMFRITKRGRFYSYGSANRKLQRIKVNKDNYGLIYPDYDFVGGWKKLPKKSKYWKEYEQKKEDFVQGTHATKPVETVKMGSKVDSSLNRLRNSYTLLEASRELKVTKNTIINWIKSEKIKPQYVFKDVAGRNRVDKESFGDLL